MILRSELALRTFLFNLAASSACKSLRSRRCAEDEHLGGCSYPKRRRYGTAIPSLLTFLAVITLNSGARAAETTVAPGMGNLQQAASDAVAGDTLLLEDGAYTGDLPIDKSLNLIGVNGRAVIITKGEGIVVSGAETRVVVKGIAVAEPLPLDITGNGKADALTDGLLIVRFLSGLRHDKLVSNAVPANAVRSEMQEITDYLEQLAAAGVLDVDASGEADSQTDGVLAIRHMFGFRGPALMQDAVAVNAKRRSAEEIDAFLQYFYPE